MTTSEIMTIIIACVAFASFFLTFIITMIRLARMAGSMETTLGNQNHVIRELKDEVILLRRVVTDVAVFQSNLNNLAQQVNRIDTQLNELRHGEGFVVPIGGTSGRDGA